MKQGAKTGKKAVTAKSLARKFLKKHGHVRGGAKALSKRLAKHGFALDKKASKALLKTQASKLGLKKSAIKHGQLAALGKQNVGSLLRNTGNWVLGRAANYVDPTGVLSSMMPKFAHGGPVEKTGLALVHRGEYVTNAAAPHPWKTAVVNPFAVPGGCRIPDETSYETFTVSQTGSFLVNPPSALGAGDAVFAGMRLRPSLADGTSVTENGVTVIGDAINPCLQTNTGGLVSYEWQSAAIEGPAYVNSAGSTPASPAEKKVTYLWGPFSSGSTKSFSWTSNVSGGSGNMYADPLPANGQYGTIAGPMGYALQQGSTCRPTAWGIRIKYAGLTNTTNNINPYGRIFFGIHTPEYEGNQPGQVDFDTQPVYDGTRTSTGAFSGGPGFPLLIANMQNDHIRGKVGMMTMDELRARPDGIVIATGPRSTSERLFKDVDYYAGQDRVTNASDLDQVWWSQSDATKTACITNNQVTALRCSQPWFFVEQAVNVTLHVEYILLWEVVPSATAYTLPGTLRAEPSNTAQMDAAANYMSAASANPDTAVAAASVYGRLPQPPRIARGGGKRNSDGNRIEQHGEDRVPAGLIPRPAWSTPDPPNRIRFGNGPDGAIDQYGRWSHPTDPWLQYLSWLTPGGLAYNIGYEGIKGFVAPPVPQNPAAFSPTYSNEASTPSTVGYSAPGTANTPGSTISTYTGSAYNQYLGNAFDANFEPELR